MHAAISTKSWRLRFMSSSNHWFPQPNQADVTSCLPGILILASQQELPRSLLSKATYSQTFMVAHVYALGLPGHNSIHRTRRPGQDVLVACDELMLHRSEPTRIRNPIFNPYLPHSVAWHWLCCRQPMAEQAPAHADCCNSHMGSVSLHSLSPVAGTTAAGANLCDSTWRQGPG